MNVTTLDRPENVVTEEPASSDDPPGGEQVPLFHGALSRLAGRLRNADGDVTLGIGSRNGRSDPTLRVDYREKRMHFVPFLWLAWAIPWLRQFSWFCRQYDSRVVGVCRWLAKDPSRVNTNGRFCCPVAELRGALLRLDEQVSCTAVHLTGCVLIVEDRVRFVVKTSLGDQSVEVPLEKR